MALLKKITLYKKEFENSYIKITRFTIAESNPTTHKSYIAAVNYTLYTDSEKDYPIKEDNILIEGLGMEDRNM